VARQEDEARMEQRREMRRIANAPRIARQEQDEERVANRHPPRQEQRRLRNNQDGEERLGKLKFTMPKFSGGPDPEEYLLCPQLQRGEENGNGLTRV